MLKLSIFRLLQRTLVIHPIEIESANSHYAILLNTCLSKDCFNSKKKVIFAGRDDDVMYKILPIFWVDPISDTNEYALFMLGLHK